MRFRRLLLCVALVLGPQAALGVDFQREVLPLLSDRCFRCHGPDAYARQAGLRLDDRGAAIAHGAITPGDTDASSLVERVFADDERVMPPREAKQKLSPSEREVLRKWIAEGAAYQKHWAFVDPQRVAPAEVRLKRWPAGEIDRFVLARMEAQGLSPNDPADPYTLVRRLHLDLTGLPPSAEQVRAFVADASPNAYGRLVDRLLQSPHFGERMALDWLDCVRYADTNGFSIDGGRHLWLWRDWVIHAFNTNLPYDRFLTEQLAGDLLDDPTPAQLIATGMQRNNMVTHEGGTIPAENLANYNADRVKTLGEAVMGLTLGCAQCHDHKYDPITQRDYYRLFAFFNTISDQGLDGDGGVNPRPYFRAKTVLQTGEEDSLRREIARLEEKLANPIEGEVSAWEARQQAVLEERGAGLSVHPTRALAISTPNASSGFEIEGERTVRIGSAPGFAAYDVLLGLPAIAEPVTGLRVRFLPDDRNDGMLGHGRLDEGDAAKTFTVTALSMSADRVPGDQVNLHRLIVAQQVTASSWREGYRPENVLDPRYQNGWSPQIIAGEPQHLTYTFDRPVGATDTPYLTVQLNFGAGGNRVAGKMQLDVITGVDDGSSLPPELIATLNTPPHLRGAEQQQGVAEYFAQHAPATRPTRIALENARERLGVLTEEFSTMIMAEAEQPRATHVLERGSYAQPGEQVTPGVPEALPAFGPELPDNRLGLARWLVAPGHPLTARVAVNRVWKQFFGAGLVRTPADFGLQGSYPTHQELLDWLAVDFVESGWDVKRLVRNIVSSAAYRQSSIASEELQTRDPLNELLARGPRFRLQAELVRDLALATSGLLSHRLGGPSVNPYAPGDLWREVSHYGSTPATAQTFVQDHGEKLYRRSLYTYWKRTVPPPNLAAFDAPSRETCVVDRPTTNTPLQALVLLNDPQFVEAARAFAEQMIASDPSDDARLRWGMLACVSRPASEAEVAILSQTLGRERVRYAGDPTAAQALLWVGESPRTPSIERAEHAAWTQVASLMLNLSEAVTRN
ncbi:PSD1 and planctomycete cytochrome C domain-containing protein [Pirellulimonas nuda]|nr:PSD1 and planctomycete cytochrome C domain-containing protein [Pirellulimonas nuda]